MSGPPYDGPLLTKLGATWLGVWLTFLCQCGSATRSSATTSALTSAAPNVLVILADDLGWADVGYHGSREGRSPGGRITTPHLDALARAGRRLEAHYVTPQCTPTRTALLTGRFPSRFDTFFVTDEPAFPDDTLTLPRLFKAAGYRTGLVGKWHLGATPGHRPWEQGFDDSYGALSGFVHPWTQDYVPGPLARTWHRNGEALDERGHNTTELVTAEAERLLRGYAGRPWFLMLSHFAVHAPVDAPKNFTATYETLPDDLTPADRDSWRRYLGFVAQLDASVGRLVDVLRDTRQFEDTLILFLSDNGAAGRLEPGHWAERVGDPPLLSTVAGSNAPLRGQKATVWEGGIRTPAFVHWPRRIPEGIEAGVMHVADWLPTFAAILAHAGRALPSLPRDLDGWDQSQRLFGRGVDRPRTLYWKFAGGMAALRQGDWKLITFGRSGYARKKMPTEDPERTDALFDLGRDPYEEHDVARAHPAIVRSLREALVRAARHDEVGRVFSPRHSLFWRPGLSPQTDVYPIP
ncbi:MAG: arylsulfatase [Myxococcales bacterium]|nr:arylsulfatase [Myxococcales bacterium]